MFRSKISLTSDVTKNYLLHTSLSFAFRLGALAAGLITTRVTLSILGELRFGVWSTMLSVLNWVAFLDFGLGDSLRTRVAACITRKDLSTARVYIASTYALIALILSFFAVIFVAISTYLPWQTLFNTKNIPGRELRIASMIAILLFLAVLLLQVVYRLFYAVHRAGFVLAAQCISAVAFLIAVIVLSILGSNSLISIAFVYGTTQAAVGIAATTWFFSSKRDLGIPSPKHVDFRRIGKLNELGLKFLVNRLAGLIVFATDTIIIIRLFGPAEVTPYQVLFRLFSVPYMIQTLVTAPLWTRFTEAWENDNKRWMHKAIRWMMLASLMLALADMVILIFYKGIVRIWLGSNNIVFAVGLPVLMSIVMVELVWNTVFTTVLSGIGNINLQTLLSLFVCIVNIPLSVALGNAIGIRGIILATVICIFPGSILLPVLAGKIINIDQIDRENTGWFLR